MTFTTTFLLYVALLAACLVSAYTELSDASLAQLPGPGTDFDIKNGALLAPILRVRIPATQAIEEVRHHFTKFWSDELPKWDLSWQNSTQFTVLGYMNFANIIYRRDPPWAKNGEINRLTLVAHYDSKLSSHNFIGATDSAAPCAMLMHIARSVDEALTRRWDAMQKKGDRVAMAEEEGLQVILLDGEEALREWTAEDSLYGARSLAAEWEDAMHPAMSTFHNELSSISNFVLLDLLGGPDPTVPSYFPSTHWAYQKMANVEHRLRKLKLLRTSEGGKDPEAADQHHFLHDADKQTGMWLGGQVDDDHMPFFHRGVEILHLIPSPFPAVWHKVTDDGEHLDGPAVEDWAKIVAAFTAEWMGLEGYLPTSKSAGRAKLGKREAEHVASVNHDELLGQ